MASVSDPETAAATGGSDGGTPKRGRRRTKSSSDAGTSGGGESGGGQVEQMQIATSPEQEAAGGEPGGGSGQSRLHNFFCGSQRRKAVSIIVAITVPFLLLGLIAGLSFFFLNQLSSYHVTPSGVQILDDDEWKSLEVDLVFPGDPDYIEPYAGGYNPDGNKMIDELVAAYPWQSKACGMSFRNLKNESPKPPESPTAAPAPPQDPNPAPGGDPPADPGDPGDPGEPATEAPAEPPANPDPAAPSGGEGGGNSSRIHHIGSVALKPGQIPWNLEIFRESKDTGEWTRSPFCGATLISAHYAITATHCLPFKGYLFQAPYRLWAVGGAVRYDQLRGPRVSPHQKRLVSDVFYNRKYPVERNENGALLTVNRAFDLSMIRWEEPFRRLHTRDGLVVLSPACVPGVEIPVKKYSLSYVGQHAYSGMGETGHPTGYLRRTDRVRYGEFTFDPKCNAGYEPEEYFLNSCRDPAKAAAEGKTGHCGGDSGGPVSTQILDPSKQRYFVSGVISFGEPVGCVDGIISGNVRVEAHAENIDQIVSYYNSPIDEVPDVY